MDKALKTFLNSLHCPVCGGQVDILLSNRGGGNYGCAASLAHYSLIIRDQENPFRVLSEQATVYDSKYEYNIVQTYWLKDKPDDYSLICIWEVDPELNRIAHSYKSISFDKILFDFKKINKDKFLNKIKTILVFS